MYNKKDVITIRISKETQEELKSFGLFGDTYEDIIKKLMNAYNNNYEDQ